MRAFAAALLLALTAPGANAAALLVYGIAEEGGEPYPSRIVVTGQFLRMDGGGTDGFVLFDRTARTIYSVSDSDRSIFVIPARPVAAEPPLALEPETVAVPADPAAPTLGGHAPRHRRLLVNGVPCHEVIAAPGLLPEAADALREFSAVLAGQKAQSVGSLPAGMLDACDLAVNVFHAEWPFSFGLPIRQWGAAGRVETLMEFDPAFTAPARLFRLPPDYERFGGK